MKTVNAILISLLFPMLMLGGEKEDTFLKEKMLPLAQEFVKRNELPTADFGTNNIQNYKVRFFTDGRAGCTADLKLSNSYSFSFISDGTNTEAWFFNDGKTRTYYALEDTPKEKIDAVKALNLQNKLNDKTALEVAERFFKLQGHKEEDFLPPELTQLCWTGPPEYASLDGRLLPYYEVGWYRKDVKLADRDAGVAKLSHVRIEVSGIDSHLISYSKHFMPIGSDF